MPNRSFPDRLMLLALLALCGHATAANTMVNVLLQDSSTNSAIQSDRIVLDRRSVPAGKVTFRAINQSKQLVHEMLVVPAKPRRPLPYDETKAEVVESRIKVLGDIDDLRPGASRTITVDLEPGSYILLCNQPGHYKAGMHTKLVVTR